MRMESLLPVRWVLQIKHGTVRLCAEIHRVRNRAHWGIKASHSPKVIPGRIDKRPSAHSPVPQPWEERIARTWCNEAGARSSAVSYWFRPRTTLSLGILATTLRGRRSWADILFFPLFLALVLSKLFVWVADIPSLLWIAAVARLARAHNGSGALGGSVLNKTNGQTGRLAAPAIISYLYYLGPGRQALRLKLQTLKNLH